MRRANAAIVFTELEEADGDRLVKVGAELHDLAARFGFVFLASSLGSQFELALGGLWGCDDECMDGRLWLIVLWSTWIAWLDNEVELSLQRSWTDESMARRTNPINSVRGSKRKR